MASFAGAAIRDVRFALRSFLRTPGFTLVAGATIALGIGAATSVFTIADALLLRPLPFPNADRLVHLWTTRPAASEWRDVVSGATYLDWERDARSFSALAAYRPMDFNVVGSGLPERIAGVSITPGFFEVLGVRAALGQLPRPEDGVEVTRNAVVLTDDLWKKRFGADSTILGRILTIDGRPCVTVAVLPREIAYPAEADLYVLSPYRVPLTPVDDADMSAERTAGYLRVVGRLADGASLETARAEMRSLSARESQAFRDPQDPVGASVVPLREDLVRHIRPTIDLFLGAVGLLLLVVCANVANLLILRASRRGKELAIRMSLGAGIPRLRRQLLTEAVVLAVIGGVPGVLLAAWGTRTLASLLPAQVSRCCNLSADPRMLALSLILTLGTGVSFGVAPLMGLSARKTSLTPWERRGDGGSRPERLRDGVVVTEMALAVLLLVCAGLMLRTYRALTATDPGFDPSGVLVAHVSLPASRFDQDATMAAFYEQALAEIRALPGVESAATILTLPMHWAIRGTFRFSVEGRVSDPEDRLVAGYQVASTDYFETLRIPLLRGRGIVDSDREGRPLVVVINEAMARRYWPGEDPLGRRVTFWGDPADPATDWATIVGVVGNTVKGGLDTPPEPEAYVPLSQSPMARSTFVVRTSGAPYALARPLRDCIQNVDASLPLYGLLSLEDVLSGSLDHRRLRMILLGLFAGAAVLLTGVGLYGVVAFSVGQRTREIGIRMALGATRDAVVGLVVRQGLTRVLLGASIGTGASLAGAKAVASEVFGVSVVDPLTYGVSILVVVAVASIACVAPAIRATRIDPAVAVRNASP